VVEVLPDRACAPPVPGRVGAERRRMSTCRGLSLPALHDAVVQHPQDWTWARREMSRFRPAAGCAEAMASLPPFARAPGEGAGRAKSSLSIMSPGRAPRSPARRAPRARESGSGWPSPHSCRAGFTRMSTGHRCGRQPRPGRTGPAWPAHPTCRSCVLPGGQQGQAPRSSSASAAAGLFQRLGHVRQQTSSSKGFSTKSKPAFRQAPHGHVPVA